MNDFFINITQNLNLPEYKNFDPNRIKNILDPIDKIITKYENHSSIKTIKEHSNPNSKFAFENIDRETFLKTFSELDSNISGTTSDIPTKILKENAEFFTDYLLPIFNNCIEQNFFPDSLKLADITPVLKKETSPIRKIIGQSVSFQMSPKSSKNCFSNKLQISSILFFLSINVDFAKVSIHKYVLLP